MATKTTVKTYELGYGSAQQSGQSAIDGSYVGPPDKVRISVSDTFTGVDNPSYKTQIRKGQNATTAASGTRYAFQVIPCEQFVFGFVHASGAPIYARRASTYMPNSISFETAPVNANSTLVLNTARSAFTRSVEKVYTQFTGGTALAELRETLRMIKRPASALRKYVNEYLVYLRRKQGKIRKMPKPSRVRLIQDSWLEASFGWLPALHDLDDARKYLDRRFDQLVQEILPVNGKNDQTFLNFNGSGFYTTGVANVGWWGRTRHHYVAVLAGGVSSQATGPQLINASAMGLAPRSFVPTLWEIMPWSFLFDYFGNIGEVLTGWSNQHLRLAWGRETFVREGIVDVYGWSGTPDPSLVIVVDHAFRPGKFLTTRRDFTRVPISTPPVPGFHFEIPGFGTKWINMAALKKFKHEIRLN